MESAAVLGSFHGTISHQRSILGRSGIVPVYKSTWHTSCKLHIQGLAFSGKLVNSPRKQARALALCAKTSESTMTAESDGTLPHGSLEKNSLQATFPNEFEALVLQVCDETEVAELKLKVGDFEMHLKRNIEATNAPVHVISQTTAPPIPVKPTSESVAASLPPSPPKSSMEKVGPFTNVSVEKSKKLAALEASGSTGYVLVSSPTVGSFQRGRTLKGKKQAPSCKEGDVIKEGQVIGFLDQFGTELPVRSDVAGEVIKILFNEGEAVGYGDPLIAVLPSFHDIN